MLSTEQTLAWWLETRVTDNHIMRECTIDATKPITLQWEDAGPGCPSCGYGGGLYMEYGFTCKCGKEFSGELDGVYYIQEILAELLEIAKVNDDR